jgi:micrococcal nuclease
MACRVLTVYDGDTLGCDFNGDGKIQKPEEQVRMLGVDSPEMHYSRKNPTYGSANPQDEPVAKEASRWLKQAAEGKAVYLEFDVRRADKYDRTLAYVFVDAKQADAKASLNAQLLRQGYATVLFIGKNRRYETDFTAVETEARTSKKGLWAAGN